MGTSEHDIPQQRSEEMLRKLILTILIVSMLSIPSFAAQDVPSGPSIALPPAQVILDACKQMGIEAVDMEYVKSRLPDLINKTGKVFVIDARPSRNYDEGHIPTAFSMFDARFDKIYPLFEKLNIPKDAEIILGIGRPCPMSLSDAKQLKEKGYTNFRAFVKGPVWVETFYNEVSATGAKKYLSVGAVLLNLTADSDLAKFSSAGVPKDKAVVVAGPEANLKTNYAAAQKIFEMGYKKLYVFNGNVASLASTGPAKKTPTAASAKQESKPAGKQATVASVKPESKPTAGKKLRSIKPGKDEGEIDKEFFRKIAEDKPSNVVLVDVRTPFEYAAGHFEGAKHIYINDLFKNGCNSVVSQFPKDSYVIFVCATGARAGEMYYGIQGECKNPNMKKLYYLNADVDYSGGKATVK
jgi:hydroxyacylglutathione hydrolase